MDKLEKITHFIQEHHVLNLATHHNDEISVCSLFYVYDAKAKVFIVASSSDTKHIEHIMHNASVAGNILLETDTIGKIQGLQFLANFHKLKDTSLEASYFKAFPYALALLPTLWKVEVNSFKFTDNRLGFGKKLIWP